MNTNGGVYAIRNLLNGGCYIGATHNFKRRWLNHKTTLRRKKGGNRFLQQAWDCYGESCFEFVVLQECSQEQLKSAEFRWLLTHPTYNYVGGGRQMTQQHRENLSASKRGRVLSEEHKRKISESGKGRKQTPESIIKMLATREARKVCH